jgi:hypothetical protein
MPPAAGPKQTQSLVGFILGIAAFVLSWVFILGLLLGVGAIIVSLMAKGKEPGAPKWMWIIGLVGGILGVVTGLIVTIVTIIGFVALGSGAYTY